MALPHRRVQVLLMKPVNPIPVTPDPRTEKREEKDGILTSGSTDIQSQVGPHVADASRC